MSSIFQSHKCCPQHIGKVNLRSGPISCLMYDPSHLGSNLEYAVFLLTMQTCSSRGMQAGKSCTDWIQVLHAGSKAGVCDLHLTQSSGEESKLHFRDLTVFQSILCKCPIRADSATSLLHGKESLYGFPAFSFKRQNMGLFHVTSIRNLLSKFVHTLQGTIQGT